MPLPRCDRAWPCRASIPHSVFNPRAIVATLLLGSAAMLAQAQTVKLAGSGNGVAAMEVLAEAYRAREPGFRVQAVPNLGSSGGLKALVSGAIDIAVIGRELKSDELAQGLKAVEYGRTPLVLGTSRQAPQSVSLTELADLFAGRVTQWPDGTPVRVVLRPTSDSDTMLMSSWSPAVKEALAQAHARPGMIVAPTDRNSADQIERLAGSIGSTTLAMILAGRRDIRVLPIEGVTPSVQSLADKSYRYFKRMYLVTRINDAEPVNRFADFARSPAGRAALERIGHLVDFR